MIIKPFDDILLPIATDLDMNYASAPLWEINQIESSDKDSIYWALPFTSKDTFTSKGIKITKMLMMLFFLRNNKLTDNQAIRTPIVDAMHDKVKEFQTAFENSDIQPKINSYGMTDVYNDFDANRSGVCLTIDFEFVNTLC